jgi:riboflavin synthase
MFTGLVEGLGRIVAIEPETAGIRLVLAPPVTMFAGPPSDRCQIGDSIAINGCCLTVIEIRHDHWIFQAGTETLSKTMLGTLQVGDAVNAERSLRADARIGGHFVQGHVDGVGTVDMIDKDGEWISMWFRVPQPLARLMVPKGSVAVDGISLTVVNVEAVRFSVALIPHTLQVTTLGGKSVGDPVNIETDILGKYVEKLLGTRPS